jgi:hypothetical protein
MMEASMLSVAQSLRIIIVASLLSGLLPSFPALAQSSATPAAQPAPAPTPQQPATTAESRKAWGLAMAKRPMPKNGCFTASYPSTEWQEVPCGRPSPYVNYPCPNAANNVGDGCDYVAKAPGANLISSAQGSFLPIPGVTGVNSESGYLPLTGIPFVPCTGTGCIADVFSLQMNSQSQVNDSDGATFFTPACNSAPNGAAGCSGWQQFVFSTTQGPAPVVNQQSLPGAPGTTPGVFIEYWLYNYGSPCPPLPSWATTPYLNGGADNCVFNGPVSYFPPQSATASELPNLIMTSAVTASTDSVTLVNPNTGAMAGYNEPNVLTLANVWTEVEFNVFGDCCAYQATFTGPTVLVPTTSIDDGTMAAPTCVPSDGTTGETNNLILQPTAAAVCCPIAGATPAIEFMEALDTKKHSASCTPTTLEGDPHITTADGTHFNFQGAGEFVSLKDPDRAEIQTRQAPVSTTFIGTDAYDGLTTCVSLNTAVAARVGEHRVTWEPNLSGVPDPTGLQLRIDGTLTALGPHGMVLGTGGRVVPQAGGALEIDFPDGKTLLATPTWWASQSEWYLNVDISHLGLQSGDGTPSGRGIAGSIANGSWLPALPDGASLGTMPAGLPARYDTLYTKFADAWRVNDRDSLFDYAPGTSTNTFTNRDWPKQNPPCVVPNTKPLEPASEAVAAAACQRIPDKNRRADCVFDVQATGDLIFAKTYLATQRLQADSTTTTLTADAEPTQIGEWVTFTASVVPNASAPAGHLSGTVQFAVDGSKVAEPVHLNGKGGATWATSQLKVGTHRIAASFVPDADSIFLSSASPETIHEVKRCSCDAAHDQK